MNVGVLKFGGSSLANGECIRHVARLIAREREAQELFPVVVVSAMEGVTDLLFELAGESAAGRSIDRGLTLLRQRHVLAAEESVRASVGQPSLLGELGRAFQVLERDLAQVARTGEWGVSSVCAWGERLSVLLLTASVRTLGTSVEAVREAIIVTEDGPHFRACGGARPLPGETGQRVRETLAPLISRGIVPIVPGFVGCTPAGRTTLLGRGGSDWTATLVASALDECAAVFIYTDVCGIHSADPRVIGEAHLLPQLSYSEAAYLAWFGAKILHPQTLNPVVRRGIPVHVKCTFAPDGPGTVIGPHMTLGREMGALALRRRLALVSVRSVHLLGSAEFQVPDAGLLARAGIIPFAVCASPGNQLSLVVDESLADETVALLQEEGGGAQVACLRGLAACTYVGAGMLGDLIRPGCALTSLAAEDITVEAISLTQFGLTLIVGEVDAERTLRDLHAALLPVPELVSA